MIPGVKIITRVEEERERGKTIRSRTVTVNSTSNNP